MSRPLKDSPVWATGAVMLLLAVWAYIRLFAFVEVALPLTFVVPMLICVWTRQAWHVWLMATSFVILAYLKVYVLLPEGVLTPYGQRAFFGSTLFNIVAGGLVIHAIIRLRARIDDRNARLLEQNGRLEAQARQLSQQNEEIKAQSEELTQQNEEIEFQAEELSGRNEEMQRAAERLSHREEILQSLLESARSPETGRQAMAGLARRSLPILGAPADCVAVLKIDGPHLRIKVQAALDGGPLLPDEWPIEGSIGGVVLAENKTAYVSDLTQESTLAAPFGTAGVIGSILATPMRIAGAPYGVVVACSRRPSHWSHEQFRHLEWVSAQCGLMAESLRWQTALAEHARKIEAANQAKDQFLAMLSHELRTPLTPVLAAAGELEEDPRLPADVRADLAMIRRNVAIQSRLVDDLLDVTRLGRGKLELDLHIVDLAELLEETAVIVGPDLDAKNQTLALDLAAAGGRNLRGDGPRLHQVFWNLLKNANKFSPANTTIRLATRLGTGPEPTLVILVADEGVGIEPAHLDRIFLPFEQIATRERLRASDGGLGLGLAIAKAVVELHRGTISVASDGPGRGTTFTVELPLPVHVQTAKPATHAGPPRPTPSRPSLRILLVEDHADTGRVLARLLRNSGYEVEHAETALDAWDRFGRVHFDLVISDLGLPDESGIELMRRLRSVRPDVVGICLSGYGMEHDLDACREAGFAEHLTKPVDLQRLRAAIGRNSPSLPAQR